MAENSTIYTEKNVWCVFHFRSTALSTKLTVLSWKHAFVSLTVQQSVTNVSGIL